MEPSIAEQVLARVADLVTIPSVVGYEGPLLGLLGRELDRLGMAVRVGRGVVVGSGARAGRVVVSAHVDRHGLICTGPGQFTYAAHALPSIRGTPGGHRHAFARTICDRFGDEAVRAYDPATGNTVADGQVAHMAVCGVEDLGVRVPVIGLDAVGTATPVAFSGQVVRGNGRVAGQLDNVLGVAMALVLADRGFDGTLVFTSEEEIGGSWRHLNHELLQHTDAPETLLVLDTSPFDDAEAVDRGAVVLRWRDATAAFDVPLVTRLIETAQGLDIPVVVKDRMIQRLNEERRAQGQPEQGLGRTELGRLVKGNGGWANGATLQVPTTGYHTNAETTSEIAVSNVMQVLLCATGVG